MKQLALGLLAAASLLATLYAAERVWVPMWAFFVLTGVMVVAVYLFAYSLDEIEKRHGWGRYYRKKE